MENLALHYQTFRVEDRVQLSREIHDNLGQSLTVLKMNAFQLIKELTSKNEKNNLNAVIGQAQELNSIIDLTIQSVRKISRGLRPSILDNIGLLAAIENQVIDFRKQSGINCKLISMVSKIETDPANSLGIFRIIQEALTNVIRHANATQVTIRILKQDKNIILEIIDNGCGIKDSKASNPATLGLMGMKERAELFGGKLSIAGKDGKGTKIILIIPQGKKENHD
jgi:two-component system, NarL family, sensor histidine kinase UhpB